MRKKMNSAVQVLFSLFTIHFSFIPVVYAGAGSTSADFLNLGIGARAIAMGGAFTGLADDVSAEYWNPAGLSRLTGKQVLTMYDVLFEGMSHVYLGFGSKLIDGSAVGLQVNYFNTGNMPISDSAGNESGSFTAGDLGISVSYARNLNKSLSFGGNVKVINENLAPGLSGSGYGADIGALYEYTDSMHLGFTIQNLGTGI